MILYLVRHGQSVGNVSRTFHGQTDYPLTDLGRQQAREVAEKLREVSFTRCCASDLRRAWDTALICLEDRDMTPEVCIGLREHFVGEMEDISWEESEVRFPGIAQQYWHDWFHTIVPGGETPGEMLERVGKTVDEIIAQGEDTLIAAHNGSLTLILLHLGLMTEEEVADPKIYFHQGTYTAIEVTEAGAKLLCFNR